MVCLGVNRMSQQLFSMAYQRFLIHHVEDLVCLKLS